MEELFFKLIILFIDNMDRSGQTEKEKKILLKTLFTIA